MSTVISNLVIEMSLNNARLMKRLEESQRAVDSAMRMIAKSIEIAKLAFASLGGGLSVYALSEMVKGAIDAADAMNNLSKSTGLTVGQLAGLKLAAKQSGTDLEGVAGAINKLSVNIASDVKKFSAIGVSATDPLEAFKQLADAFVSIQDPQLRAAVAAEALGKQWQSAAPLLAEGGRGIGNIVAKGKELSGITPEMTEAATKFNNTLAEMGAHSEGLKNQLMMALLPSLQHVAEAMNEASSASKLMSLAIQGVGAMFDGLVWAGGTAINVLKTAGVGIMEIVEMTAAIATGNGIDGVKAAYDKAGASMAQIVNDQIALHESFVPKAQDDEMARLINRQSDAVRRNSGAIEENARAFIGSNAVKKDTVDLYAKMLKQADDLVASIQFETKLLSMNSVEKETAVALQKLMTMGIKEGTKEYEKYSEAIIGATLDKAQVQSILDSNKRVEEERLASIKKIEDTRLRAEKDYEDQMKSISNQVGQSLSDALMNGGKSAGQYLQDLFRTLVLRPIVQPLITGTLGATLYGATSSAATAEGVSGAAGAVGATGGTVAGSLGLAQAASSLKNLFDMATGSFASLGSTVSEMAVDAGIWMMNGEAINSSMFEAGQSLVNSSAAFGAVAEALGGVGAGLGLGNLISGGLGVGGSSWNTVGSGTVIGAAIGSIVPGLGTALGAAAGGVLGGLVNKMFGSGAKEYGATGLTGSYSATGANVQQYQDWNKPGGWFSGGSSGTEYSTLAADVKNTLDYTLQATAASVSKFSKQLGMDTSIIKDYTQAITIDVQGLSAADAEKKITESLTAFGNTLTTWLIPDLANFARLGETSSATLSRLSTSLTSVNQAMSALGLKLYDVTLAGADTADRLATIFGGVDKLVSATDYYYQNFYSTQERAAKTTEQLTGLLNTLGLAMPGTKEAFRAMVESANAAGNTAQFAALIGLAPTFNELQASLATLQPTAAGAGVSVSSLDSAFTILQKSLSAAEEAALAQIEAQKAFAQSTYDAASASLSSLTSLFDYIKGQVSGILQAVDVTQSAAQGVTFVRDALSSARTMGGLPDQSALAEAVSAARAGLVSSNFGSSFDMRLAQMSLAGDLQSLQDIAGGQKSTAQSQLDVAQAQLSALDAQAADLKIYYSAQLSAAQAQVDQLKGVNSGVLAVADALAAFGVAVSLTQPAGGSSMSGQIDALYQSLLGRSADPSGLANWTASGLSIDGIKQGILGSQEYQSIPHFASGGRYGGGLALVGEQGPELINFRSSGTVYNARQTAGMMSGEQVVGAIDALREDSRSQARAVVSLQSQLVKYFQRWDADGLPETRTVTA